MILDDIEVQERFESPLNLLNRLKSGLSHRNDKSNIPSLPPTADRVIDDLEEKLKYGGLKSKAAAIMNSCLDELSIRIPEVQKAEKLATIAAEMNKVIVAQNENKKDETNEPRYVIYSPQFVNEEHFETIYVKE